MKAFRKIAEFARRFIGKNPQAEEWWAVKALIPRSWFTKKGPGVTARAREAWRKMTPGQRRVCVRRGWFPAGGPR